MRVLHSRAARAVVFALGLGLVAGCSSKGKIETVSEVPTKPFPAQEFETFAFAHDAHQGKNARPIRAETTTLIHNAVASALEAKGYREVVDPAEADFLVEYVVALEEWLDIGRATAGGGFTAAETDPLVYGAYGGTRYDAYRMSYDNSLGTYSRPTAKILREGSIAVHLLDGEDGTLLWGATSTRLLKASDEERREAVVGKVVDHTLAALPPRN